jgi:hypothetical protein
MVSELTKIALVHLYSQGYTDENLTNFELSLTNPSIIFEQEKIALLKEKVELANSMMENKLLPSDFIYEHIFQFSEDKFDEYKDLIMQDAKRKFRLAQIENEGNDPLETGKSYGTPHDLASLYGRGRYEDTQLPDGYDEKNPLGRPEEKVTDRNTQDNAFGKDLLGVMGMKKDNDSSDSIKPNYKGGSPLALESKKQPKRNADLFNQINKNKKRIIFESDINGNSLLDESQIRE